MQQPRQGSRAQGPPRPGYRASPATFASRVARNMRSAAMHCDVQINSRDSKGRFFEGTPVASTAASTAAPPLRRVTNLGMPGARTPLFEERISPWRREAPRISPPSILSFADSRYMSWPSGGHGVRRMMHDVPSRCRAAQRALATPVFFRLSDHQGNLHIRESCLWAPERPRMQAAGLQCLKLQIAVASSDTQTRGFPGTQVSRKTRSTKF